MAKRILVLVLAMDEEPWRTIQKDGQRATWAGANGSTPVLWLLGQTTGPIRGMIRAVGRVLHLLRLRSALKNFRSATAKWASRRLVRDDGSLVITSVPEMYLMTNAKTVAGFQHILENYDFDYVLRTNSSTYVNLKMLAEFVDALPETGFYGGTPWTVDGLSYATGTSILLSRDLVQVIVEDKNWEYDLVDDLAVGKAMDRAGAKLYPFPRVDVCTSEDLDRLSVEHLRTTFIIRCKGLNGREHDVAAMQRIHRLYQSAGLA